MLPPDSIMHFDVHRGQIMKGKQTTYNFEREMNKVCTQYAKIWNTTERP